MKIESMAATLQDLLDSTAARLTLHSDTPGLDSRVLLAHVLNKPQTWALTHPGARPDPEQAAALEASIRRLEGGEPLPYVLGHWEFFGLDFDLTPDVLIPRPETEVLVERAILWLGATPAASSKGKRRTVADIGTGSGCIAISIAVHVPDARLLATDISLPALQAARRNALKHRSADRIDFVECDMLPQHIDPLSTGQHFDLICANLPYIPTGKLRTLPVYGREPALALDGGPDGLDPFRNLLGLAPDWLAPGGRLLIEIEATRGPTALSLAYDAFSEAEIRLHQDLTGHDRLLEIQLTNA